MCHVYLNRSITILTRVRRSKYNHSRVTGRERDTRFHRIHQVVFSSSLAPAECTPGGGVTLSRSKAGGVGGEAPGSEVTGLGLNLASTP